MGKVIYCLVGLEEEKPNKAKEERDAYRDPFEDFLKKSKEDIEAGFKKASEEQMREAKEGVARCPFCGRRIG